MVEEALVVAGYGPNLGKKEEIILEAVNSVSIVLSVIFKLNAGWVVIFLFDLLEDSKPVWKVEVQSV